MFLIKIFYWQLLFLLMTTIPMMNSQSRKKSLLVPFVHFEWNREGFRVGPKKLSIRPNTFARPLCSNSSCHYENITERTTR